MTLSIGNSIARKLIVSLSLAVLVTVGVGMGAIDYALSKSFEGKLISENEEKLASILDLLETNDNVFRGSADKLGNVFADYFKYGFQLDSAKTVKIGAVDTPVLLHDDKPLNMDFAMVDHFNQVTGGVATVFARASNESGADDFVRITTSLKKEDGTTRAIGTYLGAAHPAYQKMLDGQEYLGKAMLFGRDYMTKYIPIRSNGNTIGILFIGLEFTQELKSLKDKIRQVRIGKSGYAFALDARPGQSMGTLVIHPKSEGDNIITSKDENGREFIKEMLEKKTGTITYPWRNEDESSPRQKTVMFAPYQSWGWVLAIGYYIDDLHDELNRIRIIFLLTGCAIISVIMLVSSVLLKRIATTPLKEVMDITSRIEHGDLRSGFSIRDTQDETGKLMRSIKMMVTGLGKLIGRFQKTSDSLTSNSRELASTVEENTRKITEQKARVMQVATAAEEMSQTVIDIAKNAGDIAASAETARKTAMEGYEIVNKSIEGVRAVADTVRESGRTITSLGERSHQIGDIVGVIKEIADQTNLLALNAAIEAARAGEQGRGFAVVADEVRKLAERTTKATSEISKMIAGIQAEVDLTIRAMDSAANQVESGMKYSAGAGEALNRIVDSIAELNNMVRQIASATEQMSSTSEIVSTDLHEVTSLSSSLNDFASRISNMATVLSTEASELQSEISTFKIDNQ